MYIFESIYMLTYVYSRYLGYSYSVAISGKRMQVFSSMRSDSMLAFVVWNPSVFFLLKNVTTTGCLIELLSQPGMITMMVVLVQHIWHVWVNDFTARDDFTKSLHVWPQTDFGVVLDHCYFLSLFGTVYVYEIRFDSTTSEDVKIEPECYGKTMFAISMESDWINDTSRVCVDASMQKKTCYIAMYKSYMSYIYIHNIYILYIYIIALLLHTTHLFFRFYKVTKVGPPKIPATQARHEKTLFEEKPVTKGAKGSFRF